MKKIILCCAILITIFASVVFIKTLIDNFKYSNSNYKLDDKTTLPTKEAVERFSKGLMIKTISNREYDKTDFQAFNEFIKYIQSAYPEVFKVCDFKLINNYNILLKFNGKNKEAMPNLLTAHYDVVGTKNEGNWQYPPFSGYYDKNNIYSRGTIDDKGSVFAILEALNELIKENYQPQADLYVAFSQAEETGSPEGAKKIIEYFKENNIRFKSALDEGGRIVNKNGKYFAFVGTAEKGGLLTKITVTGKGCHASMPEKNTAVEKLSKLILAFTSDSTKPILSKDIEEYYFKTYDSYGFFQKLLISNRMFFKPILYKVLSKNAEDNARIHSTTAVTVIETSNIINAVSSDASMFVDTRILPEDNIDKIKDYINKVIKKTLPNEEVKIEYLSAIEPSKSARTGTDEYIKLTNNIQKLYPDITVAPYLTLGGTDAREYAQVSDNTYRFLPCILTSEEAALMHSDNEFISLQNWGRMISFYKEFISTR